MFHNMSVSIDNNYQDTKVIKRDGDFLIDVKHKLYFNLLRKKLMTQFYNAY